MDRFEQILDLLKQYESEWTSKFPDAVMKSNIRDRVFALARSLRTPNPPANPQEKP